MGILGIFGTLGAPELIIIFILVLMLFGAKRIPEIARGLGKGIREFKSATTDISRELTIDTKPQRTYKPPAQQPIHASQTSSVSGAGPTAAPPQSEPTPEAKQNQP